MTWWLWSNQRCEDGRVIECSPCHDDPDYERDIGLCLECMGAGCEFLAGRDEDPGPNPDEGVGLSDKWE